MTKPAIRLANCYVPLRLKDQNQVKHRASGDGESRRTNDSLRRMVLQSNVVGTGSAMVELGHTKVLCRVQGPVSANSNLAPSSINFSMEEGTLYCEVKYSPNFGYSPSVLAAITSGDARPRPWIQSKEADLSRRVLAAISAAVPLDHYPKLALILHCTVLQDDGSVLAACCAAASIALARAHVELFDVVTTCSVALNVSEKGAIEILADPDLEEEHAATAVMTLATLPTWKQVTVWEQVGRLSPEHANEALAMCRKGCKTMHRFLRDHLLENH